MKDKKRHIDKLFGDQLKGLQPEANAADWDAIASKMQAQQGANFGDQLKNLSPTATKKDWKSIVSKMPPNSLDQKNAWWWLPLLIAFVLAAYPALKIIDQSVHNQKSTEQSIVINNQIEENSAIESIPIIPNNKIDIDEKINADNNPEIAEIPNRNKNNSSNKKNNNSTVKQNNSTKKTTNNIDDLDIQFSGKANKTENQTWKLSSKSLKSLYQSPINNVGVMLALNKDIASWPKIIEPKITKPDLISNLSISPMIAANRYSSNFKTSDANWQNKRAQAENAVVLPDLGIKVNSSVGKIAFNSGLIYSLKGQQINGDVTYQLYDSFPHFNPQGELIDYFRLNYRDTTVKLKLTNTYSYIEIPFNIGYQFKLGNKHIITPNIGTTLSFFTHAKGQSIAPNLGLHNIADNSLYNYRKMVSSWQVQLNYNYLITNKIQFETGIQYRKNINGIYSSSYEAKEKLMNLGLSFGLNYKF